MENCFAIVGLSLKRTWELSVIETDEKPFVFYIKIDHYSI